MDTESLRTAYTVLSAARIDYNVRKWDVIRVAALFAVAVFAASGGLLSQDRLPRVGYWVAGPALVLFVGMLWSWARSAIKRESKLQWSVEFSMYQIEMLLGLHAELDSADRWLPDQASIFPMKHLLWQRHHTGADGMSVDGGRDLDWWLERKAHSRGFVGTVDVLFACFFLVSVCFGTALLSKAV
jgi:hypothetical protein